MKFVHFISLFLLYFLVVGCSAPVVAPVKVELTKEEINYLRDVKPILDKRCVSCHSCYNAPCQAKFSSFEGIERGATKIVAYDAMRLRAIDPTRLFIDAKTTDEWHSKGFYSTTISADSNETHNDSTMMHLLYDKKINPDVIGSYSPESDELICPKNKEELNEYIDEKENHGMPYGFPAVKEREYATLAQWLHRGAHGPTEEEQKRLESPSKAAALEIQKWEAFLNKEDAKHSVTARYLYEHLFLAHWNFKAAPTEFYEIVRSSTPYPQKVEVISSIRPYDNPNVEKFYYRFVKIHSTIVFKTHMVVEFDDEKLDRFKELFIEPEWIEKPHYIDYEVKMSANPFVAFYQIPSKSRYQFLLDNSHYIVTTFIRGPVCRGQMALNVIHDHFWVMFADPETDLYLNNLEFMKAQFDNLSMPIETSDKALLKTFNDAYKNKYEKYFYAK
ncbi:MAG: fatty acid cis/trans isomerase, partial [Campylobacterota bacterium]|nr:fatty acid cis/trans isomerase [Campylobacterota bacterium]